MSMKCFVCGRGLHTPTTHKFWSTEAALAEAREYDRLSQVSYPSMTASETLDPREAVTA